MPRAATQEHQNGNVQPVFWPHVWHTIHPSPNKPTCDFYIVLVEQDDESEIDFSGFIPQHAIVVLAVQESCIKVSSPGEGPLCVLCCYRNYETSKCYLYGYTELDFTTE